MDKHSHEHEHTHSHKHPHTHSREDSGNPSRVNSVLKYMLQHNKEHAHELEHIAEQLADAGQSESSASLELAVLAYGEANKKLEAAYKLAEEGK